jgi:hypothetical protein
LPNTPYMVYMETMSRLIDTKHDLFVTFGNYELASQG